MDKQLVGIPAPVNGEEVIDLRQYWQTIMQHKTGILSFSFVVTLLTILVVYSMTPVYRATATLLIESQQAKVVSIEEIYGLDSSNTEYYLTQFEILKSRRLAENVIRQYNLVEHPEFNQTPFISFSWRDIAAQFMPDLAAQEPSQEDVFQGVVDAFIGRLSIAPVRKTQLVKISFDAFDRVFAAKIANAIGEAYIDSNLEAKLSLTIKATSWLNERLGGLKEKLSQSEQALQAFRDREQIVGSGGGLDIANRELDLLAAKLVDSKRARLEVEGLYSEIKAMGANAPAETYESIPAVLRHPVIQSYKESMLKVEQKKSELSKRYGFKHPKMVAVTAELSSARSLLNTQIMSVVRGIENKYRIARQSERALQGSMGKNKQNIQGLMGKSYQLKELEQEVKTNRALYDSFFTRLNETTATSSLESANARLSDPAVAPRIPAKPKKKLIVILSLLVSLMFAVVCAFLLESLNNSIKTAADVQEKLAQAMLGLLPELKDKAERASYLQYIEEPKSGFSESVRTIRTGLVLSSLDNPHKVIAVTSTVPGEGKTSVAFSLAYSLGQLERVLLIDADMRRPSIGKFLAYASGAPGLSNLVAGTATLEECIHSHEKTGIDVMSSGIIPPNPLELLSSQRFATVLQELEGRYDRIVIDTAPCQAVSDALVLSKLVGSMVYVVKADDTSASQVKAGLKRLLDVEAPVAGVVLNRVSVDKGSRYYAEGYAGYYDVYGYGAEEKPR
ncbi:MAG: polysaccharide biosynthesis tyrosine autokinase [Cycloclasticus sp.]